MNDVPKLNHAGAVIRELREKAKLTLPELAERLGWDKGRLSKYETDQLQLSTPVIEKIAAALDIPPSLVLLRCLQHRFPELQSPRSKPGRLLKELLTELANRK